MRTRTSTNKRVVLSRCKVAKNKSNVVISGKQAHEIINVNHDDKDIVNESMRTLRSNKLSDKNNASQCRLVRTCRSDEPGRCTDFGANRKQKHRNGFFCHECDSCDTLPPDMKARVKRNSARCMCKGGHKSRMFPATKIKYPFVMKLGNHSREDEKC